MQNQIITDLVKVMDRGLMVIPKEIRKTAGISKGSFIKVIFKAGQIVLKPLIEEEKSEESFYLKGIRIRKSKYSKEEGLKILLTTKKISWSKKDDQFLAKGRKQVEERLKKINNL